MSPESVEIVRRIYAALDLSQSGSATSASVPSEPCGEFVDPETEWMGPREFRDLADGKAVRMQDIWERDDAPAAA